MAGRAYVDILEKPGVRGKAFVFLKTALQGRAFLGILERSALKGRAIVFLKKLTFFILNLLKRFFIFEKYSFFQKL